MRRGAALLKRLQLQMEAFSSMELTRRNFAAMGSSGKARLTRRIEFAEMLKKDLEQLKSLSQVIVDKEQSKLDAAEMERDFVDTCYFPIHKLLPPVIEKAIALDKNLFYDSLLPLSSRIDQRYYTTTLALAHDLCDVIHTGINTEPDLSTEAAQNSALAPIVSSKSDFSDYRDRKKLGKRILKAVQPQLEMALRLEAEANHRPFEGLKQELETMMEASLTYQPKAILAEADMEGEQSQDVIMVDSSAAVIAVGGLDIHDLASRDENGDVAMADVDNQATSTDGNIEVDTSAIEADMQVESTQATVDAVPMPNSEVIETKPDGNGTSDTQSINTPPATNGYVSVPTTSQPAPPTPPQSNGSLGRQPMDALTDGGVLWYLHEFEPQGTSAAQEQWNGRNLDRSLSEELTEIDDDELKGLGVEINEESITASPADTAPIVDGVNHISPTKKAPKAKKRKTTYRRR
ncbi:hypothetical protein ONZ43_g6585 [Nemania bipapillata]|uniref:Uncharacterized protein n=1 Tax=Nemania bipapillata TaxID=110536 RepID=A0ACC2HYE8_9PEZI|nr:hypothetical protein ONZ43_g6585 [Nemania bipapillata]